MSHHLLNWRAFLLSEIEVAVVVGVAAGFAGRKPLQAPTISNLTDTIPFCLFTSWVIRGEESCINRVQESLELYSNYGSDVADFSTVGHALSFLLNLPSGHPSSGSHEQRTALTSKLETSHGLTETAIGYILMLTLCYSWVKTTKQDASQLKLRHNWFVEKWGWRS